MSQLTRIVAAVVDTTKAIFYKENGNTVEILQGDTRLRPLLEYITPLLSSQGYADVDLSSENSWRKFEEETNGTVRFFRIAKDRLKSLFTGKADSVAPVHLGHLPLQTALTEIMENATSVKSAEFSEDQVAPQRPTAESDGHTPNDVLYDGRDAHFDMHPDTIVAVTESGKLIPGVERIKSQFTGAINNGNTKGLKVFLERIGKVVEHRQHTVEDLLRFMERGDLPIADDGTIIIYKKLTRKGDHYVDAHTGKVKQKVGSYVHMDESLVDPNRRNECSNGLHVARRGYINTFSGDVTVLAKVRPEDVIAVPDYDANKMRVCGYHIIAELTPDQFEAIECNKAITTVEGGEMLLSRAIAGNHIGVVERVKITQHRGEGLVITPQKPSGKSQRKAKKKVAKKSKTTRNRPVKALEADRANNDSPVNIRKVVAKTKDANVSLSIESKVVPTTQADVAKALWDAALAGDRKKAKELLDFKKKAKKGWASWGLPPLASDTLKALIED